LFPAGVGRLGEIALELLERERLEIVQLLEDIRQVRGRIRVDAEFFQLVLRGIFDRLLRGEGDRAKEGDYGRTHYNKREAGGGGRDALHLI
jgi:hypothetical protein